MSDSSFDNASWIRGILFRVNLQVHARSRQRTVDDLLKGVELPRKSNALEIGCGSEFSSAYLAFRYGISVTGTDVEAEKVEAARRKNGNITRVSFQVADATALPFADSSFTLLLAQNVFHHVGDWRAAAREVCRVLRPGGLFLFSDITGTGTLLRLVLRLEKDHGFQEAEELISIMSGGGLAAVKRLEPHSGRHKEFAILFRKQLGPRGS